MSSHSARLAARVVRQTNIRPCPPHRLQNIQSYHSYESPAQDPYPPLETEILSTALSKHVPETGFTMTSLRAACKSTGHLDATTNLFPRGAYELVSYHLQAQRLALSSRLANPPHQPQSPAPASPHKTQPNTTPTDTRIQALKHVIKTRLAGNITPSNILPHYTHALGLMSLAENIPASLRELAALADEIVFLSGDTTVDGGWYTRRARVMGVYAAVETFMATSSPAAAAAAVGAGAGAGTAAGAGADTRPASTGLSTSIDAKTDDGTMGTQAYPGIDKDTDEFLDRRLAEMAGVEGLWRNLGQWAGFQGIAAVNLARSYGVKI